MHSEGNHCECLAVADVPHEPPTPVHAWDVVIILSACLFSVAFAAALGYAIDKMTGFKPTAKLFDVL